MVSEVAVLDARAQVGRRAKDVQELMARIGRTLSDVDRWEPVKYGRWRSLTEDLEVETNYVYGEGTIRAYRGRTNTPYETMKVRGDANELLAVFVLIGEVVD